VGSEFDLNVRIVAVPWIPIPELRIVVDGSVIETISLADEGESEHVRFNRNISVALEDSGPHWVVVETGVALNHLADPNNAPSMGTYSIVNPGHLPLAFSNPIFLNASAD